MNKNTHVVDCKINKELLHCILPYKMGVFLYTGIVKKQTKGANHSSDVMPFFLNECKIMPI